MRTFYIFKINNEYYNMAKNFPFNLYYAYLNIKTSTKNNVKYLYHEYFSFTEPVNKENLNKDLYNKMKELDGYNIYGNIHMFNNYYTDEVSKLTVFNTYMILKSNNINSTFLKELNNIPNLFVIDFEKEDYFFLNRLQYLTNN